MYDLSALRETILTGNAEAAATTARNALDAGIHPVDIINDGISPAMDEVGRRFEEGEFFVPELLIAARATKEIFRILHPLLAQTGSKPVSTVVVGTVRGDLHDIGKNLVGAMLEGGGFKVIDLGVDVPPEKFIAAVQEKRARILGLAMKKVIDAIQTAGIRD